MEGLSQNQKNRLVPFFMDQTLVTDMFRTQYIQEYTVARASSVQKR